MPDYTYSSPAPWDEYKTTVKHIVIHDGVTSIGNYAFNGFTALESVEIPASVTSIGNYSFRGCSALSDISLAGDSYTVSNYSFLGCNAIETVALVCGSIDETKFPNYANITFERTHVFSNWTVTVEPSCEVGTETCVCTVCGEGGSREIAALGHDWGEWQTVYAPTYELTGMIERICARDNNHVGNFEMPALSSGQYVYDDVSDKYSYEKDGQTLYFDFISDAPHVIGGQYRTEGAAGIRFCTEVFVTNKNGEYAVDANDEVTFENVESYGTLIIPLDLIDDPADLVLTANGKINSMLFPSGIEYLNIEGHKYYHKFDDRIQFTAVLVGIPDAGPGGINYDRDFVAVSYITYNNGETVYSEPCVKNIEQLVAAASA